jgi:hypothetical protein
MRVVIPEQCGMVLGNSKHKMYFLDININRLIQYDKRWPDFQVSPWSVSDLAWIFCLSKKLGVPSPIPQLALLHEDAANKFGWEDNSNTLIHIFIIIFNI